LSISLIDLAVWNPAGGSPSICRWNRSIRLTRTRFRPWGS